MTKKYEIDFFLVKPRSEKIIAHTEIEAEHITGREYKEILGTLFQFACRGIKYKWLVATVKRNGEKIMTIRGYTECDGPEIRTSMAIARPREKYRRVRIMTIAE